MSALGELPQSLAHVEQAIALNDPQRRRFPSFGDPGVGGGEGLPAWSKQNRSIEDTDIVLWYTVGFHHAPVPEDWPVLPAMWHEFYLRLRGFFSHSPVIDLPPPPMAAK